MLGHCQYPFGNPIGFLFQWIVGRANGELSLQQPTAD
jgi:hypothetical protein